jgi:hypothetical protein
LLSGEACGHNRNNEKEPTRQTTPYPCGERVQGEDGLDHGVADATVLEYTAAMTRDQSFCIYFGGSIGTVVDTPAPQKAVPGGTGMFRRVASPVMASTL